MNKELEIKIETTSKSFISIKRMLEENYQKITDKEQEDVYYSPIGINFYDDGDRCLRMRREGKDIYLSYKRIYENGEKNSFIEEYETNVASFEMMDNILSALNFERKIVVRKRRSEFFYQDNYLVALDVVENLGYFIEIENKNEKDTIEKRNYDLVKVAKTFGLDLSKRNTEGYSNMLYKKCRSEK